jgi:hypothetical protein
MVRDVKHAKEVKPRLLQSPSSTSGGQRSQSEIKMIVKRADDAKKYPRIQILTIADLLRNSAQIQMPTEHGTFKQAPRVRDETGTYQEELFGAD